MSGQLDPAGTSALALAVDWFQGTLLGSLATGVAVIAVAGLGFLLLSGRIHSRRAVQVIVGCFIIFGASSIAHGIIAAFGGSSDRTENPATSLPPPPYYPTAIASPASNTPYDPYAGAAIPTKP